MPLIVPTSGVTDSNSVNNNSSVSGATVSDALDTLSTQSNPTEHPRTSGENISALQAIRYNSSGEAVLSSTSDTSTGCVGISKTAANSGNELIVVTEGGTMTDASWSWDMSKLIYLGIDGSLTQTANTSGYLQAIAIPLSTDSLRIKIDQRIKLI